VTLRTQQTRPVLSVTLSQIASRGNAGKFKNLVVTDLATGNECDLIGTERVLPGRRHVDLRHRCRRQIPKTGARIALGGFAAVSPPTIASAAPANARVCRQPRPGGDVSRLPQVTRFNMLEAKIVISPSCDPILLPAANRKPMPAMVPATMKTADIRAKHGSLTRH